MNVIYFSKPSDNISSVTPLVATDPAMLSSSLCTLEQASADQKFKAGMWQVCAPAGTDFLAEHHVFMMVIKGTLKLAATGKSAIVIKAGQAFVVQAGTRLSCEDPIEAELVYSTFEDAAPGPEGIIVLDPAAERPQSPPYNSAILLSSPGPVQHGKAFSTDSTGAWRAGVWDSTSYHRETLPFNQYELIHMLEGSVQLKHQDGSVRTFSKGDTVMVPKGFPSDWHSPVSVLKYYSAYSG